MWNREKIQPKNAILSWAIILAVASILPGIVSSPVSAASAEMYYSIGQKYATQGNFDMAVVAFEKAVKLSPGWPEAHNALGEAYVKLLRFEEAVAEFDRALNLKPDYTQAERNRRSATRSVQRYEPMKGSRLKRWHKVAIIGGITAAIALISALVVHSAG